MHTTEPWIVKELGGYEAPGWALLWEDRTPGKSGAPSVRTRRLDYRGGFRREDAILLAAAPDLLRALDRLQANPNDPAAHREALDAMRRARGQS